MASLSVHCRDCELELGEPFEQVHRWLDELFRLKGPAHRKFRHCQEGVEQVRAKWGDRAARAAELHILLDNPGLGRIPVADDYVTGKLAEELAISQQGWENMNRIVRQRRMRNRHDK
jgi:hypothetical protein